MNGRIFDEQCRLCRFLNSYSSCAKRKIQSAGGVDVCIGYEAEEV